MQARADQLMPRLMTWSACDKGGWLDLGDEPRQFVQRVAAYVNYRWDAFDDDALVGALDATDAEKPDAWFEYPIVGSPPVTLAFSRDWGSAKLSVRITGAFDVVLAARLETLVDVLSESPRTRVV